MTSFAVQKKITDIALEHIYYNRLITVRGLLDQHLVPPNSRRSLQTRFQALLTEHDKQLTGRDFDRRLTNLYDTLTVKDTSGNNFHFLTIDGKKLAFHQVTIRILYHALIEKGYKSHHHVQKWETKFNRQYDWTEIWKRVHNKLTFESTRSVIWEQLHLNFYTQYNFNKWHGDIEHCRLCGEIPADATHVILDCKFTIGLWEDILPALQDIHRVGLSKEEMVFGLKGNTPNILLRNFLTFSLREAIQNMEYKGFYDENFATNVDNLKRIYNAKVGEYIQQTFDSYKYNNRPDLFDRYFCSNSSLVEKESDDSIIVTLPFAV